MVLRIVSSLSGTSVSVRLWRRGISRWRALPQGDVDRSLPQCAHFQHGKTDYISLGIDLFHDLIVIGPAEIAFLSFENHFEKIVLGVVPDFHVFALHSIFPFLR